VTVTKIGDKIRFLVPVCLGYIAENSELYDTGTLFKAIISIFFGSRLPKGENPQNLRISHACMGKIHSTSL
jgi:hypothetical protein